MFFFSARLVKTALTRFAQIARTVQEGDNGYQIDEDGEEEYDQNDAYYEDEVAEEEIEDQFPERGRWGGDSFMNSRRTPAVGRWQRSGFDAKVTYLPTPLSKTVLTRFGRPRERIKRRTMVIRSRRTTKKESTNMILTTRKPKRKLRTAFLKGGDGVAIRT